LWEFPGGKVESCEDDASALARECREELGVDVRVGAALRHTVHEYPDLVVDLILLTASMPADVEAQSLDAHQLLWVEIEALPTLAFCEADQELVAELVAGRIALPRG